MGEPAPSDLADAITEGDRLWFVAHPKRSYRIRPYCPGEWPAEYQHRQPPTLKSLGNDRAARDQRPWHRQPCRLPTAWRSRHHHPLRTLTRYADADRALPRLQCSRDAEGAERQR